MTPFSSPSGAAALRLSALVLAVSLSGCASVGPDFNPVPVAAPADWTSWHGGKASLLDVSYGSASAPGIPGAASVFADPVLRDLIAQAMVANADLQTAALHFAASRSQAAIAGAATGPQLGLNGAVTRQRQSEHGAQTRQVDVINPSGSDSVRQALATPFAHYQAGFDASWELDLWGRLARQNEAANASVAASAFLMESARISIASEVARAYVELRGVQAQLQLLQAELYAASELLALARARADGGVGSDVEVRQHSVNVDELRAGVPALDAQEAQALGRLTMLTGRRPGQLQALLQTASPAVALPPLELGLPSAIAARRPDIRAAQARLHAATASIGVAEADLYPRITLGARLGAESVDRGQLGDWGSRLWSVGPSLSLPLFDQGRRRAVVQLRTLEQQEAAVAFQHTVLRAWHEIDDGLSSYGAAQLRNKALADKRQAALAAHALAEAGYRHGVSDAMPALAAQRTLLQVQRDQARSHTATAVALIALVKASGMAP